MKRITSIFYLYFFLLVGIPTGGTQVVESNAPGNSDRYPNASIEVKSVSIAIERFIGLLLEQSDGTRKKIGLWPQERVFQHGSLTKNSRKDLKQVMGLLENHADEFEVVTQEQLELWIEKAEEAIKDSVNTAYISSADLQWKLEDRLKGWEGLYKKGMAKPKEFECETWKIECQLLELKEQSISSRQKFNRLVKVIYCDHGVDYFVFIDLWGAGEKNDPQKLEMRILDEKLDVVKSNTGTPLVMSFVIRPPQKKELSPLEKIKFEGDVHFENKEYRKAIALYENIAYRGVTDGELNTRMGVCSFHTKELDRAIVFFKQAVELGTNSVEPLGYLSWIYLKRGEDGKAKEFLLQLSNEYPDDDFTFKMWGLYAAAHQDHKMTFKHLKKAVQINSSVKDWISKESLLEVFRDTEYFERIKKMKRTDLRIKKSK